MDKVFISELKVDAVIGVALGKTGTSAIGI